MKRVLIVEDEPRVAAALREQLASEGYEVLLAGTLAEARSALQSSATERVDLVLLDWRLPDGEGIELLTEVRKTSNLPIILVTARVELVDRVVGLELGADDYVVKPFEPRELLARVKARLRNTRATPEEPARMLEYAGISLDLETREARFHGRAVSMTRMEFGLVALLVQHAGRVFSREELLTRVWGYERTPTTRTVDTHIVQLRTKLAPDLIESVRGVGYRLRRGDENLREQG